MVIKKILKYLGLWEVNPPEVWRVKERPPPQANALSKYKPSIDYSHRGVGPYGPEAISQLPVSDKWLYVDPDYLSEA